MKRRGFLGFMGGAAVAGPQVAKNAIRSLPSGVGSVHHLTSGAGIVGGYGGKDASGPIEAKDWRLEEINRLRRLISGQLTDEEREAKREAALQNIEPIITQNVMSLQSVSAARKVAIHRTRMVAVHEQLERMYYSRRLSEYLKELAR